MKRIICLCLLLFLQSCGSDLKNNSNSLILGTDPTYPPYERIGTDGQCEGLDIDVARAIAEKLGKTLVIRQFSFDALILALNQHKVDFVLSGMAITPAREKKIKMIPYQGETMTGFYLVFWKEKPEHFTSLASLGTIAVQRGTYQEEYLRKCPGVDFKSLEGTVDLLMDLQYRKSKAALFEPQIAESLQRQFPQLQFIEIPIDKSDWILGKGIAVSYDNEATFIDQMTHAVDALKAEGCIEKLEEKWMAHHA